MGSWLDYIIPSSLSYGNFSDKVPPELPGTEVVTQGEPNVTRDTG